VRATGARRVLLIGELRTYLWPGQGLYGGTQGDTALMWKLAREAADPERLAIRFRQLGAPLLVYNYVSADWLANRYVAYAWDERQLAVYRAYAKRYQERLWATDGNDFSNGGFCLLRVRWRPLDPPQRAVWFLPGTEQLYADFILNENMRRLPELLAAAKTALRLLPDVGHAWNELGHAYALLGDSAKSYAALEPFAAEGMVDLLNVPELGAAALRSRSLDAAEALLQRAAGAYPDQLGTIRVNLAQVRTQRAYQEMTRGRVKPAVDWINEADGMLALVPEDSPNKALVQSRRLTLAGLWAMKGELSRATGDFKQAVRCFQEALRLAPESGTAPTWQALIDRLAPRTFSLGAGR